MPVAHRIIRDAHRPQLTTTPRSRRDLWPFARTWTFSRRRPNRFESRALAFSLLITRNIIFDTRSTDVARHEETKTMKTIIYCTAIAASLSLALSACGGGGSGNSASTTGTAAPSSGASATPATGASATPASGASSPAATAAISLFPAVGPSASSFTPTGDTVNDAMAYVNDKRAGRTARFCLPVSGRSSGHRSRRLRPGQQRPRAL
jgi:hypothetical protein